MLFTDKIPGILDLNGLPKNGKPIEYLRRSLTATSRYILEYINGVNGDDGFLYGGGDGPMYTGPFWSSPNGSRLAVLTSNFSFRRFVSYLDASTLKFAVRLDNSNWIFNTSTGSCIKINIDTGVVDSTFATNVGVGYAGPCTLFRRVGDYIYVSGPAWSWKEVARPARFFRIGLDGLYDNSFICGRVYEVRAFEQLTNGKFVIAGSYAAQELDRINSDGSLDTAWTITQSGAYARGMMTRADGSIVVHGDFSAVSGLTKNRLVTIDPYSTTGTILSDYGVGLNNISGPAPRIYNAIECDDGDMLCFGYFLFQEGIENQVSICRIRKDGSMNPGFKFRGVDWGTNNSCNIMWAKPITITGRKLIFIRSSSQPGVINGSTRCFTSILIDYNGRVQYTTI